MGQSGRVLDQLSIQVFIFRSQTRRLVITSFTTNKATEERVWEEISHNFILARRHSPVVGRHSSIFRRSPLQLTGDFTFILCVICHAFRHKIVYGLPAQFLGSRNLVLFSLSFGWPIFVDAVLSCFSIVSFGMGIYLIWPWFFGYLSLSFSGY